MIIIQQIYTNLNGGKIIIYNLELKNEEDRFNLKRYIIYSYLFIKFIL